MSENSYKLYPYRWVVLAAFMLINITIQILWISYAPITGLAAAYYGVSDLKIGLLAMTFMIVFIPLSLPASWAIDTFGFKRAVSIGAILMGLFGILRGLAGANYTLAVLCTIGIAMGQPFLLNAWTKVPAQWFGTGERATAVGLVTLSSLAGIALGMVLPPMLIDSLSIAQSQLLYGGIAAVSTVLFLLLAREKPATPPCAAGEEVRALMLDGLKNALKIKEFWLYLGVCFIGMGIFNGVTTWVENIVRPRGFSPSDAGTLGALLLLGGVLGAVILPSFSDKQHKRQKFIMIGVAFAIPGLVGLTFAQSAWLLYLSSFSLGFFLTSANPVGMQYIAEITYPTPEGTSAGLIQLFGQTSVVFVYIMEALQTRNGSFTVSLMFAVGLLMVAMLLITGMKDPKREPGLTGSESVTP